MVHQGVVADHGQILQLQVSVPHEPLLGLLVLLDDVGVGDAHLEVDGVGDGVVHALVGR